MAKKRLESGGIVCLCNKKNKRDTMKTLRFFYLLLCGIMLQGLTCWGYAQSPIPGYDDFPVPIDEEHFPDEVFRLFVGEVYDTDDDGEISFAEAVLQRNIDCSQLSIRSLEGVKFFFAVEDLQCSSTQLTDLDVSGCTSLGYLACSDNQLTDLDVSGCTALKELSCTGNYLASLDVSDLTTLQDLDCSDNRLTDLDVSGCTALKELSCTGK